MKRPAGEQTVSEYHRTRSIILPRRSKFNVDLSDAGKAARTYSGRVYDSAAEMRYAQSLDLRVKVRDIAAWWPQVKMPLMLNGVPLGSIVPDFKILHIDESIEFVEIKGVQTALWKLKLKLLKALYPTIKYTVVPARNVA